MRKSIVALPAVAIAAILAFIAVTRLTDTPPTPKVDKSAAVVMSIPLIGENGSPTTLAELSGRWLVLFFGYASCPDVCPTSLAYLAKEMRQLSPTEAARAQAVFISIDPKRDQPQALATYVHYFDPQFLAMTGTEAHLHDLAKQLGVYYEVAPTAKGDDGTKPYAVVHSATFFILTPTGALAQTVSPPQAPGAVRDALRSVMAAGAH